MPTIIYGKNTTSAWNQPLQAKDPDDEPKTPPLHPNNSPSSPTSSILKRKHKEPTQISSPYETNTSSLTNLTTLQSAIEQANQERKQLEIRINARLDEPEKKFDKQTAIFQPQIEKLTKGQEILEKTVQAIKRA